ncbi:AGE family epimerase/isomerase [Aphanizomenon flos-aquae NRERC-008]|jgi:mannose/cellobiose epimerase-like protein (N-acyl-D-glucosamine 2-epimerase family)|uniref:AGE family epimerase/isomerase n=1 Tax=Aphanizomenon flos-aquae FACHB-1249 TaxID=2692889 RepID=A0ABR8IUX7_APHFL|nr:MULTISPECIES: AGE family epimerase/isomerase [Aphanizomenon]MDJ0506240.1 AGE family epimerase/isomerase [Nostocales cyanobacterium LE14-WE12]MBD2391624.1 AGE family epimerase/isomerase [Aphanizomenon flos-aquae FACHB-1171]MBD2558073.1 AGE family epimerase/isomerase [Aphanizomenon flos-aquae FACHB-1290]MBD2632599.1 AGE family epimerase/isomerase [Aphanizomenon sp. FACHB-1399]MBD2643475.1 AGE family epimerase/isomerase [Aphanizomenon sp. FACHB-1401]
MTTKVDFTFSDLIAGYVTEYDGNSDTFGLKTSDGREFEVKISPMAYAKLIQNFDEGYPDATGSMRAMLLPGRYLFTYGVFYPDKDVFDAKQIVFAGRQKNDYVFEKQNWWVQQINALGKFYLKAQFGDGDYDYRKYRTTLNLSGIQSTTNFRQETDTISRLVYGFATAFMMTGNDSFLQAAENGTEYLREHMRFVDLDEGIVYWYHGIDVKGEKEDKIFASEFGDDYYAIPAYEQIYALAGPIQTYRCTGDTRIMDDTEKTIKLFNEFLLDKGEHGGYFSHLDPLTLDPLSDSLGHNKGTKNWNSVGDHAPAYLINLWLATGKQEYADMLEYTFDTIEKRFPDYENSPFVQERFFQDWSNDQTWGWQQNRAVVGHNLKIAWNLMRMQSLKAKDSYVNLAQKIADIMPAVGSDQQRGGWYDVVERTLAEGEEHYRFVWHDRKAWWQQEQAILAYQILAGILDNKEYHRLARESAAFYNAWFLDLEEGGVYFNVLANGIPYLAGGNERGKGSHSMSGYHSFELCYLAAVYTNLLITKQPMDFYFKPIPGGFADNILRVSPDILPPGSVKIGKCEIDGEPYSNFDAEALTVTLPKTSERVKVKVQIVPV